MTEYLLASAAAIALMTGVAFAQGIPPESSTTQTTTTSPALPAGSFKASVTQHGVDSDGNGIDTKRTYHSGPDGTSVTTRGRSTSPDGSTQTTYKEHRSDSPDHDPAMDSKTTTTPINR
jgi:hypothetical protein